MIKNCWKKAIALSMIATSIMLLNPVGAKASWKQDNIGWWYSEGNLWATGWRKVDGNWYYFYQNGYMAKDTQINGYRIYSNGVAASNPSEKYEDSNSYKWKIENGENKDVSNNYYYIENDKVIGKMINKNNYLYYTENGQNFTGWKQLGSAKGFNWYYMENGKRCLGWKSINGNWFYFSDFDGDSDTDVENLRGKMVNTSILDAGKSYQFDDYGALQSTVTR
ncbi:MULTISPECIES: cell wall-binding protein [Clostridium]|uniref:Cell wall-binding protein n=1 Tax=Clostridium beijerinckii TaxID=1520 RepID=A0A1S9N898_CLOBE|nr:MULTISPECIES: cell wall-binding protein [Clostridium]MBN7575631.1 cell wall-binding protein [Clostridium beijerinckii]MBN7579627.1 cell wall-binding protein [Clostridium beijerinckii]MBN7586068.1 cell wall-binding protein [Clostridium beijerinckii]MBO0522449.1 cell wall-binding protein [Clostridium beijerinckii]MZK51964.1 cell wall-binding protein [Clostridium beijerinckii]